MASVLSRVGLLGSTLFASLALAAETTPNQLSPAEKTEGWKLLFDGQTPQGWHSFKKKSFPTSGWVVQDGWLQCLGNDGGDLLSDGEYDQFDLEWDWKIEPAGNSGLKYFVLESRASALGHEYQMIDDERHPDAKIGPHRQTASFYDVFPPHDRPTKPAGEWNTSEVIVKGMHVEHWLNGKKVLEYEMESPELRAAIEKSKFKGIDRFSKLIPGHILVQDHGDAVWFRKIEILPAK